ncbi:MAG: glycosyltransferase family 2 protein [Omnitrophica bacterium]|nr:glycosyltransferase family 2 protein [Candidatus Omnitrophota bacterium]
MKKKIPNVSIIIRTKNEERWISRCLEGVFNQNYKDFEVIIVDNESSDKTLKKAKQFSIAKALTLSDFFPGKAINMGIKASSGGACIVCLSGHCIPTNERWLRNLLENFSGDNSAKIAGVYGRQQPMHFSSDADKRDLAYVFGADRKIQKKDSFFHNANSIIRREVWDKIPFDEGVTNIEDRVWAKAVLEKGYRIIYEPKASVYHYHGIHQNGDAERCGNVVRVLENLHSDYGYKSIEIDKLNVTAIIPIKGEVKRLAGKPLLAYTIQRAMESRYVKKVIVSTDNPEFARIAKSLGAEAPFLRESTFSGECIDLNQVFQYSLDKIEKLGIFPDLIVSLESTFPFRPRGLIDKMIEQLTEGGFDSVVAARLENKAIWKDNGERIVQLDEGLTPRQFKDPTFVELRGVASVTHPEFLRKGRLLGEKIGIYELKDPCSRFEVRSDEEFKLASLLIEKWFKKGHDEK